MTTTSSKKHVIRVDGMRANSHATSPPACENDVMATVRKQTARLAHDGPLSIPTDIREAPQLKEGDTVLVEAASGGVVIRPIDADQVWFWTLEWQEKEREADADWAAGRTLRFDSTEAFLAHLETIAAPAGDSD